MARLEAKWIASDDTAWDTEADADHHDLQLAFHAMCEAVRASGTPIVQQVEDGLFVAAASDMYSAQLVLTKKS